MMFDELNEEVKAKAKACKTPEELVALAKEEGIELSDEQLAAVSGGSWNSFCGNVCSSDCRIPFGR